MTTTRYTRDDVIAAAGRLFAEQGYHATSMRDVGRQLGLYGSSLYAHVASKENLLVAIVERGAGLFRASADTALALDGSPAERLRTLIRGHIDVVLDHPDEVRTFLNEAGALDETHRARIVSYRNTYEQSFRETIAAGVDDGSFGQDTDIATASIFTLSILNALERWYDPRGRLGRDAMAAAVYDQIVSGIAA